MRVIGCCLLFIAPALGVAQEEIYPGYTWQSYFAGPGLRSACTSLGYPVPEE